MQVGYRRPISEVKSFQTLPRGSIWYQPIHSWILLTEPERIRSHDRTFRPYKSGTGHDKYLTPLRGHRTTLTRTDNHERLCPSIYITRPEARIHNAYLRREERRREDRACEVPAVPALQLELYDALELR